MFYKSDLKIDQLTSILFWKRFIDDCIGIWRGTKRQFLNFVKKLNAETNKFGINFPVNEAKFGKSVDFLDVTLYLNENNKIQYKGYSKPTDARRFLSPNSFHPKHVFKSVPMSQMIRAFNRNSNENSLNAELRETKNCLIKSGYKAEVLPKIETELREKRNNIDESSTDTITFPLSYFEGLNDFKNLIYDLKDDFKNVMGETKIVFALRKGRSIGNTVVQNKALSEHLVGSSTDQKCGASGCIQCPLAVTSDTISVNNKNIQIPKNLNCKTRNSIYLWKCKLCNEENCYFGRTVQRCHKRTNGHRNCFSTENIQKSALSMHSKDKHSHSLSLNNFEIAIIKQVAPRNIKREEFRVVDKYRTKCLGLNRYKTLI